MFEFRVDNKEVLAYTRVLKNMHKSNFPIVVRNTLNDAAFDALKKTLPETYNKKFIVRNKTFLKSHSGVKKAEGFDINKMYSEVGIVPKDSKSAKELTKQEFGGSKIKPFVYMRQARSSRSNKKLVSNVNYYNTKYKLNNNVTQPFKSKKAAFVSKAIISYRLNTPFLAETKKGVTLFAVQRLYLANKGKVSMKLLPIADYEKNRKILIKSKPFIKEAGLKSYKKQRHFFIINAKKRLEKALK